MRNKVMYKRSKLRRKKYISEELECYKKGIQKVLEKRCVKNKQIKKKKIYFRRIRVE